MAAECPLSERRIVEIKMGRSKFPGKPSKIGNRKRVNLSSCALPEENESSKAAENIYLGLSMFNEAFGDNEMVPPQPFLGFTEQDVENALAEARLQQRESEIEYKKQGITVNMQHNFQSELESIAGQFNLVENHDKNKTRLCFDGGGLCTSEASLLNTSNYRPSSANTMISNLLDNNDKENDLKNKSSKDKFLHNTRSNIFTLSKMPDRFRSLQSRAAKKILQKAKMSNLSDFIKSNNIERKFILPSYSMRSLRMIKPNKRFMEDSEIRKERLQGKLKSNASHLSCKNLFSSMKPGKSLKKELKVEMEDILGKKMKHDLIEKGDCVKNCSTDSKASYSSTGKLILREPKLRLNRLNLGLAEGPFSAPSHSSSLSPNSHVNSDNTQLSSQSVSCGVCGTVRLYKFVDLGKKFGVHCCELCQKFILKIIKSVGSEKVCKLQCLKGKGLCYAPSLVKCTITKIECQACWLKLCLNNMKMPVKLKKKLKELLPVELMSDTFYKNGAGFGINNKDLRWLKEEDVKFDCGKSTRRCKTFDKSDENKDVETCGVRKENVSARLDNKRKIIRQKGKFNDDEKRQILMLKGPRVKNVCRSASVVLGQPFATFPIDSSPKRMNEPANVSENKICDKVVTTNCAPDNCIKNVPTEKKQAKSSVVPKPVSNRTSPTQPTGRTKRKAPLKTENPISIDFWETYDPEEICETGFGLIGYENFNVRALCFLCGSSGQEKLIHCASCCEPYHEFCVDEELAKVRDDVWQYDWVCPRCTVCFTCGKTSGQQLKCVKCDNSYHIECVDRVGGRLLHSPDRPWVCSVCLRCKSCNGVDVSIFVGNLPLCRNCFVLRQKGNYCPLCQRCYEDDDYDSKMMECGQCKCWVHAKCEGLSDEKYQVLSFLPESVEYICRMCCVMPPAPWWIAVEAELKSGYLGVLKALSKNRKACAMLKWSPRKQCTCRQTNFTPRALDFDESKVVKTIESVKKELDFGQNEDSNSKPAPILERKTSVEVINHRSEGSLKLTLKILKGSDNRKSDSDDHQESEVENAEKLKDMCEKFNIRQCSVLLKKCPLTEGARSPVNSVDSIDDSQDKNIDYSSSSVEIPDKRSLSSPVNPSSDSGIGSTDDELKASSLTDEESCKLDDHHSSRFMNEQSTSYLEEKKECICFLEVDTYNSRSKPFSPSLLSIKKKVTTSEYSSLQQFHMDMQRMIATTQSTELMEMYYQTVKEIFPWFDPKFSRVNTGTQKISGTTSLETTPVKNSPNKIIVTEVCKVPKETLTGQPLEYYYSGLVVDDNRSCLMCKDVGDGEPNGTGRLLYCGQNEWVHCNCALWSAEVFEEIDGSLQNVHSAISRGRSIKCPECNLKGASIGCCARNCAETYHFKCARQIGCAFMDDKSVYCPAHLSETKGKLFQKENEFEIRRPVYVELDKKRMKAVDSSQVRFAVGSLQVENLGRFITKLSDQVEAIVPEQFQCTRLFWSCFEPWKIVKYHFTVRLQEDEQKEGIDFGINLTVDHSKPAEWVEMKLKQLKYFQENHTLLEIEEPEIEDEEMEKQKLNDTRETSKAKLSDESKGTPAKRPKKDIKKMVDHFDPREDESCLSDSQNTADLIPPELEEAIFKDLPNDILDGISMQDIFMDIKSDSEVRDIDDSFEGDDVLEQKTKKSDVNPDIQIEPWDESKQNVYEWTDEINVKAGRELKRSRSDVLPGRRSTALKNNQRSCSLNWNCKLDIHTAKRKRNSKCQNLMDLQERGSMLQELRFTDVMVSTDSISTIKDLKDRLAIQHEEGKENKCLSWHMKLQPRLLQVDGGVDSSSSGSEAGESPQRLAEESLISTRNIPPTTLNVPYSEINTQSSSSTQSDYSFFPSTFKIPQVDGVDDSSSDDSDCEVIKSTNTQHKISHMNGNVNTDYNTKANIVSNEEPVKCNQCRCTYRNRVSYERHLENCNIDYMLFSSDGENSDEDSFDKPEDESSPQKVQAQEQNIIDQKSVPEKPAVQEDLSANKDMIAQAKKKPAVMANSQVQQIVVHQSSVQPTVLLQDIAQPSITPGALINTSAALQYVTSLDSQNAFTKTPLIAPTSGSIMPSSFHIQPPESQLIQSLPVFPQTNLPGIVIQQPQVSGALIPQPAPMVVSGDQMMLGTTPFLEVIHDPQTGRMFLASQNQPVYYNMETIVSNTVMQTNQYVSNVMSASSFSQTSTQVVQTSKLEQVMNMPSNIILLGQNSNNGDLLCLPTAQPIIQNQTALPTVINPLVQAPQFNAQPKIISSPVSQNFRYIQPMQAKTPINTTVARAKTPEVQPRTASCNRYVSQKKVNKQNKFKSMPMMRPNVTKSPPTQYEKAVIVPKSAQNLKVYSSKKFKRCENCDNSPENDTISIVNGQTENAATLFPLRKENSPDISKPTTLPSPVANDSLPLLSVEPKKENEFLMKDRQISISPEKVLFNQSEEVNCVLEVDKNEELQKNEMELSEEESLRETFEESNDKPGVESVDVGSKSVNETEEETVDVRSRSPKEPEEETVDVGSRGSKELEEETVDVESKGAEQSFSLGSRASEEPVEELVDKESRAAGEPDDESIDKEIKVIKKPVIKMDENIMTPKSESLPVTNLPLQETINTMPKTENIMEKLKLLNSKQNCVATKLVTIHPRLIQDFETESENKKYALGGKDDKGPKLIFDVTSDDGFKSSSSSMAELWAKICDSVQEMRAVFKIPPLPISRKGHEVLGMQNHGLQHCLEQLRGVEHCIKYKCKYFVKEKNQKSDDRLAPVKENLSGCARTEPYLDRKEHDMFAWLASRHRRLPKLCESSEEILSSARRANSLPMAMRYRHLRETAKTYVGVYRSKIHGKGLFCLREIEAGEMVIEYAGEVIRSNITDKREKYYTEKGIGCYMFRIDDHFVVDATMKGNAARFINHSCEPNCYSRVVDILGKKHIVIFALKRIHVMEELTYDYKFPFEDEKISCHCLSKKCRKYLN